MRPGRGLLLAVALAAAPGCRFFERWTKDKDDRDDPYRPPKNWADTAGRDKDKNADVRSEFKGMLSGVVIDPDGGRVAHQDIEIELTDGATGAGPREATPTGPAGDRAPVTVQTDAKGYFVVRGLKANKSYTLTARAKQGGRALVGQSVARTPSPTVRLQLRDDLDLPPTKPPADSSASVFDPPTRPSGSSLRPDAKPLKPDADELPFPKDNRGTEWSPGSAAPPPAPVSVPPRNDLVAPGNTGLDKPPVANIPNPTPPPVAPPTLLPPPSLSKFGPTSGDGFDLMDPLGRPRTFPAGRPGEMVLLHFLTTTTEASVAASKKLNGVQAKWIAAGLEVVGVAVDDVPPAERIVRAKKFAETASLNHLVYSEGGPVAGLVAKRFGVSTFPTAVLIDAAGKVLWHGDPRDPTELDSLLGKK